MHYMKRNDFIRLVLAYAKKKKYLHASKILA